MSLFITRHCCATLPGRYSVGPYKNPYSGTIHGIEMHPGIPQLASLDRNGNMRLEPGASRAATVIATVSDAASEEQ